MRNYCGTNWNIFIIFRVFQLIRVCRHHGICILVEDTFIFCLFFFFKIHFFHCYYSISQQTSDHNQYVLIWTHVVFLQEITSFCRFSLACEQACRLTHDFSFNCCLYTVVVILQKFKHHMHAIWHQMHTFQIEKYNQKTEEKHQTSPQNTSKNVGTHWADYDDEKQMNTLETK